MLGRVDRAERGRLHGWAFDAAFPDAPVALLILANDVLVERVVANRHRVDVEQAGIGHGRCGFSVVLDPPLLPTRSWLVRVVSELDGTELPGSPVRLPASTEFDAEMEAAVASALTDATTEQEIERRVAFVSSLWDRLLQVRADRRSDRPVRDAVAERLRPAGVLARRALVIDNHGMPEPNRDGGSTALLSHMRALQRLGYHVTFAAGQMLEEPAAPFLRRAGFGLCHAPWFGSVEEALRREADSFDLVYLHRIGTAFDYARLVRRYQPRAWVVYSVADLHHLRLARQAVVEQRPELMAEAHRVKAQELDAARAADAVIVHSSAEAALMCSAVPEVRVHTVAWAVPARPVTTPWGERGGAAFVGNFRHAPNVSAAMFLARAIAPAVQARNPAVTFDLVGAEQSRELAAACPGLQLAGHVPDLRSVLDGVRLTVAPLRFGAGLKAKVMDSLAAGVPCVCLPAAAEGFDFPAELRGLVAPDADAAVEAILRLHDDEEYSRAMSEAGLAYARDRFSEGALDDALRQATTRAAPTPSVGSGTPAPADPSQPHRRTRRRSAPS